VPKVHTKVMGSNNRPTGIGEIALPLVGPAISNAVFNLTAKRSRHMPFTSERVKAALKA
jgi:isoquinoline 1-oxidoreductase beta subunit